MKLSLPDVTVVVIDCVKYGDAIHAIQKTLEQIEPAEVIFFTDINFPADYYRTEIIPHLYSKEDYSKFMIKELGKYEFKTSHILVCQWDGYVLDAEQWTDDYLQTDYIGAPWLYIDGRNVGNGGFSLRSVKLHKILAEDDHILALNPEDNVIAREYRPYLEEKYGIKFASEVLGEKFSFELREPNQPTFGFHAAFHKRWKPVIVFRRTGALGDVVAMEPLLEHFWKAGYRVVLDTQYKYLFDNHFFPIQDYAKFDHERIPHRVVDLDNGYEIKPQQLHLKTYFEIAGVTDYVLRNPRLNHNVDDRNRLFKKYVCIHIDKRSTTHRNVVGIKWDRVKQFIEDLGYDVIQIGLGEHEEVGLHFNTVNNLMLQWVLKGASLMVAVDSGPANVSVALGVKSIIFFGSVNPEYIYHDLTNIIPIQAKCPIGEDHCWHREPGTSGRICPVDNEVPPCTQVDTKLIIEAIRTALK